MKREAVFCLVLVVLLLVSVFHMADLQVPGVKGASSGQGIGIVQPQIIEHRITGSELQLLKNKIGVQEEGQDYNQIVDGHGTGLAPPSEADWQKIGNEAYVVDQVLSTASPPSNVDNSATPWFPPIGNQGSQNSCVAWAVGYYMNTFEEAKEHGWTLSGTTLNETMSPSFIYNLIDNGVDKGSSFYDAIQLVCSVGECSLAQMPFNMFDCTSWPSESAWQEAAYYRGASTGYETLSVSTPDGILSLKNWISSGNLAIIGVDASQFVNLTSNDVWTLDNYRNPVVDHANTIVGYDDNMTYMEGGKLTQGAFKVANSWGVGGWEPVPGGFYWISYQAMSQEIGYVMFYQGRTGYAPTLTCSFQIVHPLRGECSIVIGMGPHDNPTVTKSFTEYILGGNQPFPANQIVFDITEFENAVPSVYGEPFFLSVYDGGTPATGTILYFSVENTVSSNTPIATVNGGYVFADLTLALNSFWVAPQAINYNQYNASVGTLFNVTVWANMQNGTYDWQVTMEFNASVFQEVACGYTDGATSAYFAGHTTVPVAPVVDNVGGTILFGESLIGLSDYIPEENASLVYAEFNITSFPTTVGSPWTGLFDINATGVAGTFFQDIQGNTINSASNLYDATYSLTYAVAPLSAYLVVRGLDNGIYYRICQSSNDSWSSWYLLPGATCDSPAAAVCNNRLYIVVRGMDRSSLWFGHLTNITDPGSFSGWTVLSGATSSAPTLTSNGITLCLVVRGLDNRIYYRIYDTQAQVWQGWNALPSGTTCDTPAASMLGSTLNVVVRGYSPTDAAANNTLWYSTVNLTDNAFSGWTMLGGATPSSPILTASQTSNSLYLTVRGNDNKIYVNAWKGANWQGWNALPTGATITAPATTIVGTKLYFVVIGMDGTSLWQSSLDLSTSNFSGWTLLSGSTPSKPTFTS